MILAVCFILAVIAKALEPEPIDWSPSYSREDTIPYGSMVLAERLADLFPGQEIRVSEAPAFNLLADTTLEANYLIINESFAPEPPDSKRLLRFVERGGTAFIAAAIYGGMLADSLGVETEINVSSDSLEINLVNPALHRDRDFLYDKSVITYHFARFDSSQAVVLGRNRAGQVNFIRLPFGEGHFLLNAVPLAFTNYGMVSLNNDGYIARAFSYLPARTIIWDEYYKANKPMTATPLRYILSQESLRRGYYLALATLLLFVIFAGKRRQRIVPVIEPLKNTSLEFTQTIGRLYYQNGDHKNLAEKQIAFFMDTLRRRYHIRTTDFVEDFNAHLAAKSGVPEKDVRELFAKIDEINQKERISEQELLHLNELLDGFYDQAGGSKSGWLDSRTDAETQRKD